MNKELDEIREKIAQMFCAVGIQGANNPKLTKRTEFYGWLIQANALLSLKTDTCQVAVVKKVQELPVTPSLLIYADSGEVLRAEDAYKKGQWDMLRAGFVQEVKDGFGE